MKIPISLKRAWTSLKKQEDKFIDFISYYVPDNQKQKRYHRIWGRFMFWSLGFMIVPIFLSMILYAGQLLFMFVVGGWHIFNAFFTALVK